MILTEETKNKHAFMQDVEAHKQSIADWAESQLHDNVWLQDPNTSPTNTLARMGRPMSVEAFEDKLLKINPNFVFQNIPGNPKNKRLLLRQPNGELEYLIVYESGRDEAGHPKLIPEYSILEECVDQVIDPKVAMGGFRLNRYDLPRHEIIPHEFDKDGNLTREGDVIFDPTDPQPGMVEFRRPWRERVRGYRTVLVLLVAMEVCSITDVERVFGPGTSREWAAKTGKHDITARF